MKLNNRTNYLTTALRAIVAAVHRGETVRRGRLRTWDALEVTVTYSRRSRTHLNWQGISALSRKTHPEIVPDRSDEPFRDPRYTGHAMLDGSKMTLCIPRGEAYVEHIVMLVRHELWHSYGIEHADYPESVLRCTMDDISREMLDDAMIRLRLMSEVRQDRIVDWTFSAVPGGAPAAEGLGYPVLREIAPVKETVSTADLRAERVARLVERRTAWVSKLQRAENALKKIDASLKRYEKLGVSMPEAAKRGKR